MNFAAIILTHGKPHKVATYHALRRQGYTGRIILLIDDEDKTGEEYERQFPGEVEVFNKDEQAGKFDVGDNFGEKKCVVLARSAVFPLAERLGLTHFVELDDDYAGFYYTINADNDFSHNLIWNMDTVFGIVLKYLDNTPALSVAWAQGGDFMGGAESTNASKLYPWRKCMNTFFCRTDRPFTFLGRLNEDVNTYVHQGTIGGLMFTLPNMRINQAATQSAGAGMTDMYQAYGTYVKSFYTVMRAPSCTKIVEIGSAARRIHHQIAWKNCTPCILDESLRKP